MNEPTVVKGRPKASAMYPPKWLAKYARKHKLRVDIEAFKHAIENTPSLAAAARELGISTATMYRWCKIWGVKVDR
jgi:DNA invertase Pin-like site-specific DNA recombinase